MASAILQKCNFNSGQINENKKNWNAFSETFSFYLHNVCAYMLSYVSLIICYILISSNLLLCLFLLYSLTVHFLMRGRLHIRVTYHLNIINTFRPNTNISFCL